MRITYVRDLREKRRWLTQTIMFVLGTAAGCYMAYLVNQVRGCTLGHMAHTHTGIVPTCHGTCTGGRDPVVFGDCALGPRCLRAESAAVCGLRVGRWVPPPLIVRPRSHVYISQDLVLRSTKRGGRGPSLSSQRRRRQDAS